MRLSAEAFIARFLQHVLESGVCASALFWVCLPIAGARRRLRRCGVCWERLGCVTRKGEAMLKQRIKAIAETSVNKKGKALNAVLRPAHTRGS